MKTVIRGYQSINNSNVDNHDEILENFKNEELSKLSSIDIKNYRVSCSGGGMLKVDNLTSQKSITIYGYSPKHGKAEHHIT